MVTPYFNEFHVGKYFLDINSIAIPKTSLSRYIENSKLYVYQCNRIHVKYIAKLGK